MLAVLLLNRINMRRRNARRVQKIVKPEIKSSETVYCRTCLSTEDLVSIFYSKESEQKRSEDLRLVTGLEIKMNDGLSQKICTRCVEIMNTALQFRRTSRKAEKTLLNILAGGKVKKKYAPKLLRSTVKKEKLKSAKTEQIDEDNYNFDTYDDTDFQNDYDFVVKSEDSKPKVKQFSKKPAATGKRKRMVVPNAQSYKCTTCDKEFRMKATYKAHMRFHTSYCVCEACGKRCRNNNQLQEHKRARHGLGRIHKCAYCDYSSATKEALTIHERRHTGERPYICDHCGSSFHRRSNLVQHIAIHLPEKNFQCHICSKREKSRKLLQVHIYKAHRERRYKYLCPVCRNQFTRPENVRTHLVRSHGVPRDRQGAIDRCMIHDAKENMHQATLENV